MIRPHTDTIIDATCGNGQDSIHLATLLFGLPTTKNENDENHNNTEDNDKVEDNNDRSHLTAQLLCIDVQPLACERTSTALRDVVPSSIRMTSVVSTHKSQHNDNDNDNPTNIMNSTNDDRKNKRSQVEIIQMSHAVLPQPLDSSSVGLIVYNLGYLPGVPPAVVPAATTNAVATNTTTTTTTTTTVKEVVVETHMATTIASLVDATSLLRVRGMISIATYPTTNYDEDVAVKLFVTCLALLSSNVRSWEEEIQSFLTTTTNSNGDHNTNNNNDMLQRKKNIAHIVSSAMEKILQRQRQQLDGDGDGESQVSDSESETTATPPNQNQNSTSTRKATTVTTTWRVSQHEKLGTYRAPVLYTVTRIK